MQQDAPMSPKLATVALLFCCATPLIGQGSAPAYIVTRLGVDTVAIERYTRTNGKLEGDLLQRYPRVRTIHYIADLGPQGQIKSLTTSVRRPGADASAPPAMQSVTRFGDTLAVIE